MHCVDVDMTGRRMTRLAGLARLLALSAGLAVCLSACQSPGGLAGRTPAGTGPAQSAQSAEPPGRGADTAMPIKPLPAPRTPKSLDDLRQQAAQRLVAANPGISYVSKPPPVLLAIPVLTVELHADGSVRRIEVMRYPGQARDTVDIAIQAVRRAAPFGDVSRLPRPWKFNETFLFNEQRKFKPMTLERAGL